MGEGADTKFVMNQTAEPNLQSIRERADLVKRLRGFFDARGFIEIQPPCLSSQCIADPYIDPIPVGVESLLVPLESPRRLFLQTSPEAALKRILAAGSPSVYSLGPVFRAGEIGAHHNVEFTMLEWYEVDGDVNSGIELLGTLAQTVLDSSGFRVRRYQDLFRDHVGLDPIECPLQEIRQRVGRIDAELSHRIGDDRDALADVLLSSFQSELGHELPLIVKDYPATQAALARVSDDDPRCAARFELFIRGLEIANGYDELRDADELARRQEEVNRKRLARGRAALPAPQALIHAMHKGLPACAGVALGVDRLLMACTRRASIDQVMPFNVLNA